MKFLLYEQKKIFSGSALKLIAVITMLIDHTAHILLSNIPSMTEVFLKTSYFHFSIYSLLRVVGRIAFPIYGFLLVEGFTHTHDRKKYALNLLLFALLSEIPWNLEHSGTWQYENQNVFFTLFLGLLCMICYEYYQKAPWKQLLCLLGISLIALLLKADYGLKGVGFLFVMYLLRDMPIPQAIVSCSMLNYPIGCLLAYIPMNLYNHQRGFIQGKFWKYAFYAFYPVHMLILYYIKLSVFGYT